MLDPQETIAELVWYCALGPRLPGPEPLFLKVQLSCKRSLSSQCCGHAYTCLSVVVVKIQAAAPGSNSACKQPPACCKGTTTFAYQTQQPICICHDTSETGSISKSRCLQLSQNPALPVQAVVTQGGIWKNRIHGCWTQMQITYEIASSCWSGIPFHPPA